MPVPGIPIAKYSRKHDKRAAKLRQRLALREANKWLAEHADQLSAGRQQLLDLHTPRVGAYSRALDLHEAYPMAVRAAIKPRPDGRVIFSNSASGPAANRAERRRLAQVRRAARRAERRVRRVRVAAKLGCDPDDVDEMSYDDDSSDADGDADGDAGGDADTDAGNGQDRGGADTAGRPRPGAYSVSSSNGAGNADAYGGAAGSGRGTARVDLAALSARNPDLALQVQKQERLAEVRARARGTKNAAEQAARSGAVLSRAEAEAAARASAERSAEGKRFLGRMKPRPLGPEEVEHRNSDKGRMIGGHPSEPREKAPTRGQARRLSRVNWAPDLRAQYTHACIRLHRTQQRELKRINAVSSGTDKDKDVTQRKPKGRGKHKERREEEEDDDDAAPKITAFGPAAEAAALAAVKADARRAQLRGRDKKRSGLAQWFVAERAAGGGGGSGGRDDRDDRGDGDSDASDAEDADALELELEESPRLLERERLDWLDRAVPRVADTQSREYASLMAPTARERDVQRQRVERLLNQLKAESSWVKEQKRLLAEAKVRNMQERNKLANARGGGSVTAEYKRKEKEKKLNKALKRGETGSTAADKYVGRWTRLLRTLGLRQAPVEVGAVERAYADAAKGGDADHVRVCLLAGLPPTRLDEEGIPLVHHAIRGGHEEVVRILVLSSLGLPRATRRRAVAEPAARVTDTVHGRRWAPLHEAAAGGFLSMCRTLLAARAGLECRTASGATALALAVKKNRLDVVELLVKSGARLDTVDRKGDTLMHVAAQWASGALVQLLMRLGVPTKQQNKLGLMPGNVARRFQREGIASIIEKFRQDTSSDLMLDYLYTQSQVARDQEIL